MKKVVLVTGVLGGIGTAIARDCKDRGYIVVGIDNKETTGSHDFIDHFVQADLSNEADNEKIFNEIKIKYGKLYAIVNNAAIQICKPFEDMALTDWDAIMTTNLRAVFLTIKNAYPRILEKKGSIVNVCSVHALATSNCMSAYAASKGALLSLTRSLALELAKDGIRINAVIPGAIDTEMLRSGLKRSCLGSGNVEDGYVRLSRKHALGRVGKPQEVAKAVSFLIDDVESSFITGQSIVVDGGALARLSTE